MGYFLDVYKKAQANLDNLFQKQNDLITGQTSGAERLAAADQEIAASRGGYSGSPLLKTLLARNKAMFTAKKNEALNVLDVNQMAAQNQLDMAKASGQLQEATATQDFWGNVIGGAGGVVSAASKIFGGPAGVAAGEGIDAVTGLVKKAVSGTTNG